MGSVTTVVSIAATNSGTYPEPEPYERDICPTCGGDIAGFSTLDYVTRNTPVAWGIGLASGRRMALDMLIERAKGVRSQFEKKLVRDWLADHDPQEEADDGG